MPTVVLVIVVVMAASSLVAVPLAIIPQLSKAATIARSTLSPRVLAVNGEVVTRSDLDKLMEQRVGPQIKSELVQQMLIDQEAKRLNVVPADKEIEDAFQQSREVDWKIARELTVKPWMADDYKRNIRLAVEKNRILTHDVPVSDEMRRDEYERMPMRYDTPNKAHVQFALVLNDVHLRDVKQLMEKGVNPELIMSELKGAVVFIGYDDRVTLAQALGDPNQNRDVFNMKPGDVKDFMPGEFAKLGAERLVVRLIDKAPGKKADLSDPKTKESLTLAVALQRAKPWQEYLSTLWANTKFECEDSNDKRYVELSLFPERSRAAVGER